MAVAGASDRPGPSTQAGAHRQRPRQADGIYGTIITASVLASAGDELASAQLVLSVLITLGVYWIADVYARLLAVPLGNKRLPTWSDARTTLAATWPLVSASFVPVLVLLLARAAGASSASAATAALVATILMLIAYAAWASLAAGLRGAKLVGVTSIAALLGLLMIILKNVVLVHLH